MVDGCGAVEGIKAQKGKEGELKMENKGLLWGFRITLIIFGIIAIMQVIPYFTNMLMLLVTFYKLSDVSPELRFFMLILSLWITIQIFNLIVNTIIKIHSIVEKKIPTRVKL